VIGIEHGHVSPLGATLHAAGCNFALYSENAEQVDLCLFDDRGERETARLTLPGRFGNVWHGFVRGISAGTRYGYRVYGPYEPARGHRFNHHKLLIDPYARALDRSFALKPCHFGYHRDGAGHAVFDASDSGRETPKCVVTAHASAAQASPPRTPWRDTIIYEAHVRGLTKLRMDLPPLQRGTFEGLSSRAMIEHLRHLGVTTVELMPLTPIIDEPSLVRRGLRNYWGYNPIAFFALEPRYAAGMASAAFRAAVERLHDAGIEVILDVVFNHTGEGDEWGPTICYRGIDNVAYYHLRADNPSRYTDFSGCGNALNAAHPAVQSLVLDSLVHWVNDYQVDGFRFDLAVTLGREGERVDCKGGLLKMIGEHPVLATRKLIAEPWDAGPSGYRLGEFAAPWAEWNDKFQNTARRFWRGNVGQVPQMAYRLSGSSDVGAARGPLASINYIATHDGMTLTDVVSFASKHNEANGEQNTDGAPDDFSWNHGVEGPTDDVHVARQREQNKRNLIATLLLSPGVPMIAAGDEFGKSQEGNNNAYCQDNELSWLDWRLSRQGAGARFLTFMSRMIALRKALDDVRPTAFFRGVAADGYKDVTWLRPDGREISDRDWHNVEMRAFACVRMVVGTGGVLRRYVLMLNPEQRETAFAVPRARWRCLVDTSERRSDDRDGEVESWSVHAHALVLLSDGEGS
jgi:glycogen operon protein